jgi:hypothetical protein
MALNTRENTLDYQQLRALSVEFGIPFRRFLTNDIEIETDSKSFFALMLSSLETEQSRREFAAVVLLPPNFFRHFNNPNSGVLLAKSRIQRSFVCKLAHDI